MKGDGWGTVIKFLLLTVILGVAGCSARHGDTLVPSERRLSVLRPVAPERQELVTEVSRSEFSHRVSEKSLTNRGRLVEIFSNAAVGKSPWPEYRLFDVAPNSVYELLGLRNADTVIAIDDLILANADIFRQAIPLLARSESATIEIRRGESPMLLKFHFVD